MWWAAVLRNIGITYSTIQILEFSKYQESSCNVDTKMTSEHMLTCVFVFFLFTLNRKRRRTERKLPGTKMKVCANLI